MIQGCYIAISALLIGLSSSAIFGVETIPLPKDYSFVKPKNDVGEAFWISEDGQFICGLGNYNGIPSILTHNNKSGWLPYVTNDVRELEFDPKNCILKGCQMFSSRDYDLSVENKIDDNQSKYAGFTFKYLDSKLTFNKEFIPFEPKEFLTACPNSDLKIVESENKSFWRLDNNGYTKLSDLLGYHFFNKPLLIEKNLQFCTCALIGEKYYLVIRNIYEYQNNTFFVLLEDAPQYPLALHGNRIYIVCNNQLYYVVLKSAEELNNSSNQYPVNGSMNHFRTSDSVTGVVVVNDKFYVMTAKKMYVILDNNRFKKIMDIPGGFQVHEISDNEASLIAYNKDFVPYSKSMTSNMNDWNPLTPNSDFKWHALRLASDGKHWAGVVTDKAEKEYLIQGKL